MDETAAITPTRDVKGRFLPGTRGMGQPISADNSREMLARREAKRHATVRQAANDAVDRGDLRARYGDAAYIAALTEAQMSIAQTIEAKGATRAAEWVMLHSGEGEVKAADAGAGAALGAVAEVLRSIAAFARALPADVVDADAEDV